MDMLMIGGSQTNGKGEKHLERHYAEDVTSIDGQVAGRWGK
jgi:hypothetical protein